MLIQIEDLAPKRLINFRLPQPLKSSDEAILFTSAVADLPQPLGNILDIPGVSRCLITAGTLSVAYEKDADAAVIKALIMAELDDYMRAGGRLMHITSNAVSKDVAEAVADSFIRPILNRDKGDIEIISVTDNCLEVRFTGHCSGCPYAMNTLQNVVDKLFRRHIPALAKTVLRE